MIYFWIVAGVCVVFCIGAYVSKNLSEKGYLNKKLKGKEGKKK